MKARYPEAAAAISNWIDRHHLPPGARLPSVRRLAENFDLKLSTAQKACSILMAQGRLRKEGYKMMVAAPREDSPAVVHPIHVLSHFDWFNRAVARILGNNQIPYRVIALDWDNKYSSLLELRKVQALASSGLIFWPIYFGPAEREVLQTWKMPMVLCGQSMEACATVGFDHQEGVRQAIEHLVKQGHTQIAYISLGDFYLDLDLSGYYRNVCLQMGLAASAATIWEVPHNEPPARAVQFLREKTRSHPQVTALFGVDDSCLMALKLFSVPRELSLVGFFDLVATKLISQKLTSVGLLEHQRLALWACTELKAQLAERAEKLTVGEPRHLRLLPRLMVRGSTRALRKAERKAASKRPEKILSPPPFDPMSTWRNIYPFLKKLHANEWRQIDLSSYVNHSLTRPHGWLGDRPLLHFPPGLRSIHGAPFQIIDEKRNRGRAVLTFRSPHSHSNSGRLLPTRISIPSAGRVRAVYFLHGCGWTQPGPFATYRLCWDDGETEEIPLIPATVNEDDLASSVKSRRPNIQDWWECEGRRDFPTAHRVLVTNPANPLEYERYLYTLQWINPRRAVPLKEIQMEVDPDAGPALALLAITALV